MPERSRENKQIVNKRSREKGLKRHGKYCLVCELCMKRIAYDQATFHHVKPLTPKWTDIPKGQDHPDNIIVLGALCEQLIHRNKSLLQLLILRVSQLNLKTYIGEGYQKFMAEMQCQYSQRQMDRAILEEKKRYVEQQQKEQEEVKNKIRTAFFKRKK